MQEAGSTTRCGTGRRRLPRRGSSMQILPSTTLRDSAVTEKGVELVGSLEAMKEIFTSTLRPHSAPSCNPAQGPGAGLRCSGRRAPLQPQQVLLRSGERLSGQSHLLGFLAFFFRVLLRTSFSGNHCLNRVRSEVAARLFHS